MNGDNAGADRGGNLSDEPNTESAPKSEAQLKMEAAPLVRMVCTGKVTGQKSNQPCWLLQTLDSNDQILPQSPVVLSLKDLKHIWVGEVIEIRMEASTYWPGTAKYAGIWQDEQQRMQWQAEARAWDTARRVEKELQNEKRRILLKERLEPLRQIYRKLPTLHAVALLAEIVYYIENGETRTRN